MSNYKILTFENVKYLYDTYNNELKIISDELFDLISKKEKNRRYRKLIDDYGIRDVLDEKELEIVSPLTFQSNKWKIENRQKHLVLSLTENCNLRCDYCGYRDKYTDDFAPMNMSKEIIRKAIKQFFKHSIKSEDVFISFYGGEPLLSFDNIKYTIEICKEYHLGQKVNFAITTNGTYLNESMIDFFAEHNFLLVISLDGPNDIHDRYRKNVGGESTYSKIINNIKLIKKKYPLYFDEKVMFNAVMAPPFNPELITDFFEFTKVNMMELKITDYFKNKLSKSQEDVSYEYLAEERPMHDLMTTIKELKKFHLISKDHTHEMCDPCGYCLPFSKRVFVNGEGNLLVCEKVDEKCDRYIIGNVDTWIDYDKLQNLFVDITKKVKENCLDCWAIRFCNTCFINENEVDFKGEYCKNIRTKVQKEYEKYIELVQKEPEIISLFNKFSIE